MSSYTPKIPFYFDNREGKMLYRESKRFFNLEYDETEKGSKESFLFHLRNHKALENTFLCGCCNRPLRIVGGGECKQTLHFRHASRVPEGECDFIDGYRPSEEECRIRMYNGAKESLEHIALKDFIASYITKEDKYIRHDIEKRILRIDGHNWRKPDVYVVFEDKEVAFEVQVTSTSQHVIHDRNNAYRHNGRFIIWIVDKFDKADNTFVCKDIAATNNDNIFALDEKAKKETEASGLFHLHVYFRAYRIENLTRIEYWDDKLIPFSEIVFDPQTKEVYFNDCNTDRISVDKQIEKLLVQKQEERKRDEEEIAKREVEERLLKEELQRRDYISGIVDGMNKISRIRVPNILSQIAVSSYFDEVEFELQRMHDPIGQFLCSLYFIELMAQWLHNHREIRMPDGVQNIIDVKKQNFLDYTLTIGESISSGVPKELWCNINLVTDIDVIKTQKIVSLCYKHGFRLTLNWKAKDLLNDRIASYLDKLDSLTNSEKYSGFFYIIIQTIETLCDKLSISRVVSLIPRIYTEVNTLRSLYYIWTGKNVSGHQNICGALNNALISSKLEALTIKRLIDKSPVGYTPKSFDSASGKNHYNKLDELAEQNVPTMEMRYIIGYMCNPSSD